jgi:hypothetical protein
VEDKAKGKDNGKENCDCIVSVEFQHDNEKKLYVQFIQEIIQVYYGDISPMLLKCKWIKPYLIQCDQYGFVHVNTHQILSKIDDSYVSPPQITQSFIIDDVTSLG